MSGPGAVRVLHDRGDLRRATERLGAEVSAAYPTGVVLAAMLRGSLIFLADLVRRIVVPCQVDFLAVSPYAAGSERVRIVKDLDTDVRDRHVLLVETIVDTGLTCNYVLGELERRKPRSLEVCTLFDRPARRIVPVAPRFCAYEAPEELLIGYGLDVAGRYRNLPFVAVADAAALAGDPDAYVDGLYGR